MKKKITGIYSITNKINNLIYVGSSISDIHSRWRYHIRDLRANKHHSAKLQNAYNKYGEESFAFSVVEEVENLDLVIKKEQFYLDALNPFYNICQIAGNCKGRKFSIESKLKMSNSAKSRGLNESLKLQQQPKFKDTEDSKFCTSCNIFHIRSEFYSNKGRTCKKAYAIKRPSRVIEGLRKAHTKKISKPIIAKSQTEIIEFESMRDCVRKLSLICPKINRTQIKFAIANDKFYYGYTWSFKNA